MRKILFMLFMALILFGSVAAADWDNTKYYDEMSKTITIKNAFGLPIIGDEIADIQLNTPQIYKVGAGYQKVAQFTIYPKKDYTNILNKFEFYDISIKSRKIKTEKQIDILYLIKRQIEIDDYKTECAKSISENGTSFNQCSKIKIGSHLEEEDAWILFNGEIKTDQPITIGLFTNVQINEHIEWIPTIMGVKIQEWSEWTQSLDVGLVAYYKFDNNAADSLGNHNGTISGATFTPMKINNGSSFDGTNDIITVPDHTDFDFGTGNFTFNMWYNSSDQGILFSTQENNPYPGMNVQMASTGIYARMSSGSGVQVSTYNANGNGTIMVTFMRTGTNVSVWINGLYNGSITSSANVNSVVPLSFGNITWANYYKQRIDEAGIWNRSLNNSELNQLYNNGAGITYTTSFNSLSVFLISPANNTGFSTTTNYFSGNITSIGLGVQNVSLLINGSITQTNTSGLIGLYNFSQTLGGGNHNYTIIAYGNDSVRYNATNGTLLFSIDLTAPAVNITYPESITYNGGYITNATKITFINITASDTNLGSCWYSIDGGSTNLSMACNINITLGLPYGTYDLRAYANDSAGNVGTDSASPNYEYRVLQNNINYNNQTIEGVLETFTINFSVFNLTYQTSILSLVYNGSNHTGSFSQSVLNYLGTKSLVIPNVASNSNLSFYWSILLADSSVYNSSSFNQSVQNLGMDNCGSFTNLIFNYTLLDEESQINLTTQTNETIELTLAMYDELKTSYLLNFSKLYNNTNPARVCLNVNLTSTTKYAIDSIVKYKGDNYEPEYYNLVNFSLSNLSSPQNIKLYDLLTADSTEFKITFKDDNFQAVPNALIHIQRQYITENNTFKVVELPKTDSNGQTLGHFVEKDIIYNILVTNGTGGEILGTFNNIIPFCADPTIGDCEINLNSFSSGKSVFDYDETLQIGLTAPAYDSVTRILSMSFVTFDGSTKNVTMQTFKYDQLGNTTACSNSLISSSGSLSCTIPSALGNSTIQIYVYVNGNLAIQQFKVIDSTGFGYEGYFLALMLILLLIIIFSDDKTAMIVALIMGMIAGVILSLIKGSFIGLGASGLFLIVSAIILIWKLNKSNP